MIFSGFNSLQERVELYPAENELFIELLFPGLNMSSSPKFGKA